jgi:glycosyltransferase involved in cell wall biosynthesis
LIEGLAELGVEQTLIFRTDSELASRARALGFPVVEVAHPLLGHFKVPAADLIHVHEARGAYWAAIEHAIRKTPYIITRRIPNPISASRFTVGVYRRASRLLGVSNDVAQRLSIQVGRPVHTILSSSSTLVPDAAMVHDIRRKLGEGPIIGHVGALHDHHKGQSVLIQAFHRLLADYPHARLLLVGEGPDRAQFEVMAQGDERIVFSGFQKDVGSWLAAMDVFAFPSREEGLGSTVLDAMQLGIPVVAATVGGLPELIGANERGLAAADHDPATWEDALRQVLTDHAGRERRAAAARRFAADCDVAAMTRHYAALYGELTGSQGVGAAGSAPETGVERDVASR